MFSQRGQTSTDSWADVFSFSRTSTDMCLSPVQRSCVAVDTMDGYSVLMNIVGEYLIIVGSACALLVNTFPSLLESA